MDRTNLLENGFFPKELPPCFTTKKFSVAFDAIMQEIEERKEEFLNDLILSVERRDDFTEDQKEEEKNRIKTNFNNQLSYSSCVAYSIPMTGLSRKEIKIPNPYHQGKLVKSIENHFSEINEVYDRSTISLTKPKENNADEQPRRAITYSSFGEFREKCVLSSYHMHIQLKVDISKYYNSIYTHAIPWATEGKQEYKRNWALKRNDPHKRTDIFSDEIDMHLRNCQLKQTKGIPIGPDTSLIISEIIGCHVDSLFESLLERKRINFVGFRYIDDYYLYFNDQIDAEIALNTLENLLADFELEINHSKSFISR